MTLSDLMQTHHLSVSDVRQALYSVTNHQYPAVTLYRWLGRYTNPRDNRKCPPWVVPTVKAWIKEREV